MTTDRTSSSIDFDRLASAWLADGPAELKDRVLEGALQEVHRTQQRRRPPAPWRTTFVQAPRWTYFAGAAVAAVAVVAMSLNLLASKPSSGGPSGSAPGASPSLAVATPGPSASTIAARPTPAVPHGPLTGTYTTSVFTPPTTFTVVAGWSNQHEGTDSINLWRGDPLHELTVGRVTADPLLYARQNPLYTISAPKAITIGSIAGQEIDLDLSPDANKANGFFPITTLADGNGATLDIRNPGSTCRLVILQVGGSQVVILSQRPTGETSSFDREVEDFLRSLRFG
jgi:hypothetical protein